MGGFMTYLRFRGRNGLTLKPSSDTDPYPREAMSASPVGDLSAYYSGELNRMERDYLRHGPHIHSGDCLPCEVAALARVPADDALRVLRAVFEGG